MFRIFIGSSIQRSVEPHRYERWGSDQIVERIVNGIGGSGGGVWYQVDAETHESQHILDFCCAHLLAAFLVIFVTVFEFNEGFYEWSISDEAKS